MKTEAAHILDTGATPSQLAAELGISASTAEAIAQQYHAPRWPTLSPELIARLPEHLQRQIKASNPNHQEPAP